jgi:hypothetical protein
VGNGSGDAMITNYTTPSFDNLLAHRGHELTVVPEPCRLVDGTVLVLEDLSTPWEYGGFLEFEAVFTGPATQELLPDFYRLRVGDTVFALHLEVVARDARFVHYVANLSESTADVALAG